MYSLDVDKLVFVMVPKELMKYLIGDAVNFDLFSNIWNITHQFASSSRQVPAKCLTCEKMCGKWVTIVDTFWN